MPFRSSAGGTSLTRAMQACPMQILRLCEVRREPVVVWEYTTSPAGIEHHALGDVLDMLRLSLYDAALTYLHHVHVFVEQLRGFCRESRGRELCNAWSCQAALPYTESFAVPASFAGDSNMANL